MQRPRVRCCFGRCRKVPCKVDMTKRVPGTYTCRRISRERDEKLCYSLRSCHRRIQWRAMTIRVYTPQHLTSSRWNSRIIVCHSCHRILRYSQGSGKEEWWRTLILYSTAWIFTTSVLFTWKVKIWNYLTRKSIFCYLPSVVDLRRGAIGRLPPPLFGDFAPLIISYAPATDVLSVLLLYANDFTRIQWGIMMFEPGGMQLLQQFI